MPQTIDDAGMIDLIEAKKLDITVDATGKVWVNVNDKCVLRIGRVKLALFDDPLRGREYVIGGAKL